MYLNHVLIPWTVPLWLWLNQSIKWKIITFVYVVYEVFFFFGSGLEYAEDAKHYDQTFGKPRKITNSVICLPTCPQPLPKLIPHKVRYSDPSFNLHYPIFKVHPVAAYVFFLVFPSLLSSPFNIVIEKAFTTQDVINPVNPFYCI